MAAAGLWLLLSQRQQGAVTGPGGKGGVPLDVGVCDRRKYPPAESLLDGQVTILVNGFSEARIPLLRQNMQLYSQSPAVAAIYILWGNVSTPSSLLEDEDWPSDGAPVRVIRQETGSLNARFLPRDFIHTRAVAICDDDVTVDGRQLAFALRVWREAPGRIVGFFPRAHSFQLADRSWTYTKLPDKYSIMLTKFMILATEYLFHYTCRAPPGVHAYVDQGTNCEDIAMNFVVTEHSGQGPMLVDGNPRDWGDTRNSDGELSSIGLSARTGHMADRGACIGQFASLWGALHLHYTSSKAVEDVSEVVTCDKFGVAIDCKHHATSRLEALRATGQHRARPPLRYAYATLLGSPDLIPAALTLAQSLRCTGALHDLVLLLATGEEELGVVPLEPQDPLFRMHFDKVKVVQAVKNPYGVKGFNKLNAWLLEEYEKVVYLDVDTLVLGNLDHLFEHPEPAAVPDVYMSAKFNSGLLVLKPSKDTYDDMLSKLEKLPSYNQGDQGFLNSYFSGWFQMPAQHRLASRYNAVVSFPEHYHPPEWFDVNRVHEAIGPVQMVHFANPWSKPWKLSSNITNNLWCNLWLNLSSALEANTWQPLDCDQFSLLEMLPNPEDYPQAGVPSQTLPSPASRKPLPYPLVLSAPKHYPNLNREVFATLIWEENYFAAAVWATSYQQHHAFSSLHKTMLIVVSSLESRLWQPLRRLFHYVRVVPPLNATADSLPLPPEFALLHAWSFGDFDKIIFVDVLSLFLDNCNELANHEPFAAMPAAFPSDHFSPRMMVLQPHRDMFDDLCTRLGSLSYPRNSVSRYLNAYFHDWFQQSAPHRISPSYGVDMWFKEGVMKYFLPWKILSFDRRAAPWNNASDWMAHDRIKPVKLWRRTFCLLLDDELRPPRLDLVCRDIDK